MHKSSHQEIKLPLLRREDLSVLKPGELVFLGEVILQQGECDSFLFTRLVKLMACLRLWM